MTDYFKNCILTPRFHFLVGISSIYDIMFD
jgi:hypothetical protein